MGSPFASMTVSDPIPLPFDEGQWIQVRKLTGKEYEAAQTSHRVLFVNGDKWSGLFRDSLEHGPSTEAIKKALSDPLTGFDRYALVRAGLVAWSYALPLKAADPDSLDAIADLDDDAIEFIARAVLQRTKPALFEVAPDEIEADKVKG